jgi:hypothetical protein
MSLALLCVELAGVSGRAAPRELAAGWRTCGDFEPVPIGPSPLNFLERSFKSMHFETMHQFHNRYFSDWISSVL